MRKPAGWRSLYSYFLIKHVQMERHFLSLSQWKRSHLVSTSGAIGMTPYEDTSTESSLCSSQGLVKQQN
ncbi:hypothetical protein VULLAG_LOCUS7309 [Vulpes lagopus]